MELETAVTAAHGVTFVRARLDNPRTESVAFRLESTLDGPVWPPRRNGRVERGWSASGYEGILSGGESRSLGFATSAPPAEDPVAIVWTDRVEANGTAVAQPPDASSTIRRHRDPRPPRSVLSPPRVCDDGVGSKSDGSTGASP